MKATEAIKEIYLLEKKASDCTERAKALKEQMRDVFDKNPSVSSISATLTDDAKMEIQLVCTKTERTTIEYFPEMLKEALSKELFDEVVQKSYSITNIDGLIKLLKAAGINPSDFKKYISVALSVDKAALQQAYTLGEVSLAKLQNCYKAKMTKSVSVKQRKQGDSD